jgi:hypothetical protein
MLCHVADGNASCGPLRRAIPAQNPPRQGLRSGTAAGHPQTPF